MPSIALTPYSTPPSLPSQNPQRKFGKLLTKSNEKTIQAWAKTNPISTNTRIQAYIRNNFGVTYAERSIRRHKEKWGFKKWSFPLKAPKVQARALTNSEVSILKDWGETNPNATNSEIQTYIKDTFGVTYAERTIQGYKKEWDYLLKKPKAQARSLTNREVSILKDWGEMNPNATNAEIQAYIRSTFRVEYSERSIQGYKRELGFTVKAYAHALADEEINTLKDWAKINPDATWQQIQAYITDTFRIVYSERSIRRYKAEWGFAAKGHKASDNDDLDTANFNEFLSSLSLPEDEDPNTHRSISPPLGDFEDDFEEDWNIQGPLPAIVQARARPLKPDQISILKDWAETHKDATWQQIQAYIRDSFGVEYSDRSIRRYKAMWGFTVKGRAPTEDRNPHGFYFL